MHEEVHVTQDTTINTSKLSLVIGIGGIAFLLAAGAAWGTQNEQIRQLRHDVDALAPAIEVRQGFQQVDARLSRIEAFLLDSRAATRAP